MSFTATTTEPKTILINLNQHLQDKSKSLQDRIRDYHHTMQSFSSIYRIRDEQIEVLKKSTRAAYEIIRQLGEEHRFIQLQIQQLRHLHAGNIQDLPHLSAMIHAFYAAHPEEICLASQYELARQVIAEAEQFQQFIIRKNLYQISSANTSLFEEICQMQFSNPNYQAQVDGFYSNVMRAKIEALEAALLVQPMPQSFIIPNIQLGRCEADVQDKICNLEILHQRWDEIRAVESSLINLEARVTEVPEEVQSLNMKPFDQIKSRWAVLAECRTFLWERNASFYLGLNFRPATLKEEQIHETIRQLSIPSWSQCLEKIKKTEDVFRIIWNHRPLNYKEVRLLDDLRPVLSNFHQTQNIAELIENLQTLLYKEHLIQPFSAQCIDAIKTCFNVLMKLMTFGHQPHFFKTQQQMLQQTIQGWITTLSSSQPATALPH